MDRGRFSRGARRARRRHDLRHHQRADDGSARHTHHHARRRSELSLSADARSDLQHHQTDADGAGVHAQMKRLLALALLLAAGCTYVPLNPPLSHPADLSKGYRWATTTIPARDSRTLVIVTFSGGGTRAAGLSYGVLKQLDTTPMGSGKLIDAIDVISSVS